MRVQGPITVFSVIGTNRDGEEACRYVGSIHRFCEGVYDKVGRGKLWSCLYRLCLKGACAG